MLFSFVLLFFQTLFQETKVTCSFIVYPFSWALSAYWYCTNTTKLSFLIPMMSVHVSLRIEGLFTDIASLRVCKLLLVLDLYTRNVLDVRCYVWLIKYFAGYESILSWELTFQLYFSKAFLCLILKNFTCIEISDRHFCIASIFLW